MSVVACKIYKDKIEMASDSIAVKGWTKINNAQNKIVKIMKYNDMIIGGCGNSDEISLLFHYMKTHTIEDMDEKRETLDIIMQQYTSDEFKYSEPAVRNVKVWEVKIDKMTCRSFGLRPSEVTSE